MELFIFLIALSAIVAFVAVMAKGFAFLFEKSYLISTEITEQFLSASDNAIKQAVKLVKTFKTKNPLPVAIVEEISSPAFAITSGKDWSVYDTPTYLRRGIQIQF